MAIQYFLDRFYMNRISLRMLIHQVYHQYLVFCTKVFNLLCNFQHILLFEPDADKQTNRIGMIDPACKVKSVINEAFNNATMLCEDYYDCAPEINIKGKSF